MAPWLVEQLSPYCNSTHFGINLRLGLAMIVGENKCVDEDDTVGEQQTENVIEKMLLIIIASGDFFFSLCHQSEGLQHLPLFLGKDSA